jgi:hypothetical protein
MALWIKSGIRKFGNLFCCCDMTTSNGTPNTLLFLDLRFWRLEVGEARALITLLITFGFFIIEASDAVFLLRFYLSILNSCVTSNTFKGLKESASLGVVVVIGDGEITVDLLRFAFEVDFAKRLLAGYQKSKQYI